MSHIGDAPVLPILLNQIPAHEQSGCLTTDDACDTLKCHDAISDRGADAVIPPRKKANPWMTVTPEPWPETKPCAPRNT